MPTTVHELYVAPWLGTAKKDPFGQIISNLSNVLQGLRADLFWSDVVFYDQMLRTVILAKPIPTRPFNLSTSDETFSPRPLQDIDILQAQHWFQSAGFHGLSKTTMGDALIQFAHEQSRHPLLEWLRGLRWDGKPRISNLFSNYFGADDTPYTRAISRMFLISLCARINQPGCKADYMIILEGAQGLGKSTACAILGGEYYSDSLPKDVTSKDTSIHIKDKWLCEIGELSQLSISDAEEIKKFLTRRVENYRPAYGRLEVIEPRQCIFIGTTNKKAYLRDETGNRRFWPIFCRTLCLDALAADREQLFAEAMAAYRWESPAVGFDDCPSRGERWWPTREFEAEFINPEQAARREVDALEEQITNYLTRSTLTKITVLEIAQALGLDITKTVISRRITAILQQEGFQSASDGKKRYWKRASGDKAS